MQSEIKQLRHEQVVIRSAPVSTVKGEPAPRCTFVTETPTHHFGLSSADGQNTIELTGRLHLDAGDYFGYKPHTGTTDRKGLASGVNLRRARIGVIGKFQGDLSMA